MNVRRLMIPLLGIALVAFLIMGLRGCQGAGVGGKAPKEEAKKAMPTKAVTIAKVAVPRGRKIGMEDVETKMVTDDDFARFPKDAIADANLIVGGTATLPIGAGEAFTPANLEVAPQQMSQKIEPGMVAVTIPAPTQPSLYDLKFLSPDDRVDVFGISGDQHGGETVSVKVSNNVRVLAVDTVISKEKEAKRKADIEKKIKELEEQKAAKMKDTPPPSAEVLKASYDDPIADLRKRLEPEIKNPSVTVEVSAAQAQVIALWRKTSELVVALHREEDAQQVLFDTGAPAVPAIGGQPGLASPTGPPLKPGLAGHVLTLDDVVPLDQRNPEKYVQRRQTLDQERQRLADKQVEQLERQVKMAELQAELRNVRRYGTRSAPVSAPSTTPSGPPPAVPPASVTPNSQVKALQDENRRLKAQAQAQKGAKPGQQTPLARSVEVYRGKEKTVVSY